MRAMATIYEEKHPSHRSPVSRCIRLMYEARMNGQLLHYPALSLHRFSTCVRPEEQVQAAPLVVSGPELVHPVALEREPLVSKCGRCDLCRAPDLLSLIHI